MQADELEKAARWVAFFNCEGWHDTHTAPARRLHHHGAWP